MACKVFQRTQIIKTVQVDYQEPATIEKLKVLLAEINYPTAV